MSPLLPGRYRAHFPALLGFIAALLMLAFPSLGQNITLTKSSLTASPIPSGQDFEYQISYTFSSTSGDFVGAVIEDQLPTGLIYAGTVTANPQVASTTAPASGANGRIRFNMVNPIAAGSSGNLRIRVRYPIGTTPDGLQVTNVATASGTVGSSLISANSTPVVTTASAGCAWITDLTSPANVALDQPVGYRARLFRPTPNVGNLNILAGSTLAAVLPVGVTPADVVNANGGTITGTGVLGDPTILTWTTPAINALGTAGSEISARDFFIQFPSSRFVISTSQSVVLNSNLLLGSGGGTCTGTDTATINLQAPSTAATTTKDASSSTVTTDGSSTFQWRFSANNTGRTALNNFTVSDVLPPNFLLDTVILPSGVTFAPTNNFITVRYHRSDTGSTLYTWPGGPFPINTSLLVLDLGLPSGVAISYIEFDMGTVPVGFQTGTGNLNRFRLEGRLLPFGWDDPPTAIVTGSTVCNRSTLTGTSSAGSVNLNSSSVCVTATVPTARPGSNKSILSGQNAPPGGVTQWQVETLNGAGVALVQPVGLDLLPAEVEYVPGTFNRRTDGTFNSAGAADPTSSLQVLPNYKGTGRTLLRWQYGGSFQQNTRSTVRFQTRVKPGKALGISIQNRSYVWADPTLQGTTVISYQTLATDTQDLNDDGSALDSLGQSSSQTATVGPATTLESRMLVKGALDTEYSRFPQFGFTTPAGTVDYRLSLTNVGSIAITNIVLLNILPSIGDVGVIDPLPRQSAWTPELRSGIDVLVNGASVPGTIVEYSVEPNPCRTEFDASGPAGCAPANWTTTLPSPLSTVKAFRVTFPTAYSLESGASMSINLPMKAPLTFGPGSIAWASFAYRAFPADGSPALSAEPIKVGIASVPPYSVGDRVWLDEDSDGYQDAGEPGIPNVRVVLYDNTGSSITSTHTDADGRYLFVGLQQSDFFVRVDESTLPAGMSQTPTYRFSESDFGNQDQSTGPGDYGYPVKVLTAIPNRTADFGYNHNPAADVLSPVGSPTGTLGDRVWLDLNGNGRQESQEPGVGGATVQIFTAGPDGIPGTIDDVAGATRTTDDTGRYAFDGLSSGAYVVRVVSDSGASHAILGSDYTQTGDPDAFGTTAAASDHATTLPIVLAPGDVFINADFGYQPKVSVTLGTLGNLVWFDTDANGASTPSNPSETGLAGVGLSVIRDVNGNGAWDTGEPILASTLTDANGGYQFQGLPLTDSGDGDGTDADYLVWVSDAPGVVALMVQTHDNFGSNDRIGRAILSPGTPQNLTLDFSFKPAAQPTPPDLNMGLIGDRVWFDADRDGIFDSTETPLSTVVMELQDSNGDVIGVTVTDPHGRYVFPGLDPALSYTVRVGAVNFEAGSPLAGMQNTFDPDGGANESVLVNLGGATDGPNDPDSTKNGVNQGIDFGYGPPSGSSNQGTISNQLWHDANADGIYTPLGADGANGTDDDEAPLAGVTLELYRDLNLNGNVDPGEPHMGITTTDNNGQYSFTGLPLVDGIFDDEIFTSDPDAVYIIHVTDTAKRLNGYWNTSGDSSLAVDDTSKPDPTAVTLTSSARTVTEADFGYSLKPGALGNFVWLDINANGIQDSGEPGIDGVLIQVLITYPDSTVTTLRTLTGDNPATPAVEHGWYQFANLLQDEHHWMGIGATQPSFNLSVITLPGVGPLAGLQTTRLAQGSDTSVDSNDPSSVAAQPLKGLFDVVQRSSGSSEPGVAGYDFGFARVYSLGNRVWLDADNNGLDDGSEPGVDGIALGLYAATDTSFTTPLATVATQPEGYFRFDGLYAGDYVIRVEPSNWDPTSGRLAGYNGSTTNQTGPVSGDGSLNVIDRDNHASTGSTPSVDGVASGIISLGSGNGLAEPTGETEPGDYASAATGAAAADAVSNLTVDFGFYRLGVGNWVYADNNLNGVYDSGDTGIDGVQVELFSGATRVATTTTANGSYLFNQTTDASGVATGNPLPPGTHYTMVLPASQPALGTYYSTTDTTGTSLPNEGVDHDDNIPGRDLASGGLQTVDFTLAAGTSTPTGTQSTLATATTIQPTVDIGLAPAAQLTAIGNRLFLDKDANGKRDGADSSLAGVQVELYRSSQTPGVDSPIATASTGIDGTYYFDALAPDSYRIHIAASEFQVGQPLHGLLSSAGNGSSTADEGTDENGIDSPNPSFHGIISAPISLTVAGAPTGETSPSYPGAVPDANADFTIDFGFVGSGSIGNRVWIDENSDARQGLGEPGLPNIGIRLYDQDGNVFATAWTDTLGGYRFTHLPPGDYFVDVLDGNDGQLDTRPVAGLVQSTPYSPSNSDFGNQDHTHTIPSQSVTGYPVTLGIAPLDDNRTADFGYNFNPTADVRTPTGSPTAALGDRVWVDSDGDGHSSPAELGVEGVSIELIAPGSDLLFGTLDDVVASTTTTDATGHYLFDGLQPGAYVVRLLSSTSASHDVLGLGYTQTGDPDHFGTATGINDHKTTQPILLAPGDVFLNVDFGYHPNLGTPLGIIGNTLWFDANANGTNTPDDPNEEGLAEVTVTLIRDTNGNGSWDSGEPILATALTSSTGDYLFEGLSLGHAGDGDGSDADYLVWISDTGNSLKSLAPSHDPDGTPDGFAAVTLSAGSPNRLDIDFSYKVRGHTSGKGLIGNTVWLDADSDGVQEASESGIGGIMVQLFDATGAILLDQTLTGDGGNYSFAGLNPTATYIVRIPGSNFGAGGVLEGLTQSGDPDATLDDQSTVQLGALGGDGVADPDATDNHINLGQNFGYGGAGSLGNLIFLDRDGDGHWAGLDGADGTPTTEDDEPVLGGVTVDLYRDLNGNGRVDPGDPRIGTTTSTGAALTDAGDLGNFRFKGLPTVGAGDADAAAEFVAVVATSHSTYFGYWATFGTPNTSSHGQSSPYPLELSTAGSTNITADFGFMLDGAAVGNRVWKDTNGEGVQSAGEPGIDGVVVQLKITYADGTVTVARTQTGDDPSTPGVETGWYKFGNLDLDEDLYSTGVSGQPAFELSVITPPDTGALAGLAPTLVHQGSNSKLDADDPDGVTALTYRGRLDVSAQTPPSLESSVGGHDFGFAPAAPTAVTLASVRGYTVGETVVIEWQTVWEDRSLGFDVERWDSGGWTRVNPEFIPARNEPDGALYHTIDASLSTDGRPRQYRLVELETSGGTNHYGPFTVSTSALSQIQSIRLTVDHLEIQFEGEHGNTYHIESTTDLVKGPWVAMGRRTADGRGRFEWIEPAGNPETQRFYRAIRQ